MRWASNFTSSHSIQEEGRTFKINENCEKFIYFSLSEKLFPSSTYFGPVHYYIRN